MKELQQRQKQILKYLLSMDDFMPVKIAALCRCSFKTVRNDLLVLEEAALSWKKCPVRESVFFRKSKCATMIYRKIPATIYLLNTEERRLCLNCWRALRISCPFKSLSEKYYVSKTSIANDLKVVEEKLSKYHLRLKKDTQGTQLVGSEMDIRKAMVDILNALIGSKNVFQEEPARIDRETILELEEHSWDISCRSGGSGY